MSDRSNNSGLISPVILKLQESIKINKDKAISEFWGQIERSGTPIFEEIQGDDKYSLITFIVREDEEVQNIVCYNAFLAGDIKEGVLERIENTNVYFKTYKVLKGIRDTYNFCKNNPLIPKDPSENLFKFGNLVFTDPFNSKIQQFRVGGFLLPLSEFESPDAPPQPYYGERRNIDHGKVQQFISSSKILNINRNILVYTPPNYSKDHSSYYFLLLFDGLIFEEHAKVSSTIDNLIVEDKIPPLVAVMIENFLPTSIAQRSYELPPNPKFLEYIIKELMPWIRENYNITSDPTQTVIAGASYGGLAASFIAFKNPEIFRNVLSMSGAYSWYPGAENWMQYVKDIKELEHWWSEEEEREEEWLVKKFAQTEKLPLKFYLDVGILEEHDPNQLFISNRHFNEILGTKGYPVFYKEFLGGHDFICWRASIADGLIYLIGK
ncbi:MAG: alpha/beta hydrolase [Promethearchaeota archaeon]